ncbi:MAG: exodeoxyribonuclease III [Cryobacterium sp.]|nr:exodeoxyribonuclease III [Oligoflexia bacterium]
MKVATFNCNSVRKRLPNLLEWLEENQPDVVALQETKVQDPDFPKQAFIDAGYFVHFRGMKSYNGVAILSLKKPTEVIHGFEPGPDSEDFRIIQILVEGIRIVNTYVPQGSDIESDKYQYKLRWYQRLQKYFDQYLDEKEEIIWLGDLNVAPEPIDVANPEKNMDDPCFHIDARKAYRKTVEGRFIDVFRNLYPDRVQYTFWDYFRGAYNRNRGWRIDHILATPALAKKCKEVVVDTKPREKESPSDHTVVWAQFKI